MPKESEMQIVIQATGAKRRVKEQKCRQHTAVAGSEKEVRQQTAVQGQTRVMSQAASKRSIKVE